MKCENLQFNLPLYAEDVLADDEREHLDAHLKTCPVCRARLAQFQTLRHDLRSAARAEVPADLVYSVRNAVAAELKREPSFALSNDFRHWLQYRVMPYTVGVAASLVFGLLLLTTLLSTKQAAQNGVRIAQINADRAPVLVASNQIPKFDEDEINLPIADASPSINPAGALLALTKSIVRGKMKDEEVVVVADVFGDGIARIAEVVEPPSDRRAMLNLERALHDQPNFAPFVPAVQDNRSNRIRVILKIQRVDVIVKTSRPKNKSKSL